FETALWCRYCLGQDEAGGTHVIEDENAALLQGWARDVYEGGTGAFVMPDLFGGLGTNDVFLSAFRHAAEKIAAEGVAGAMNSYLDRRFEAA
ncbi:MAG: mannitol dehydrogenase family protein, partial [Roseibium sp.]